MFVFFPLKNVLYSFYHSQSKCFGYFTTLKIVTRSLDGKRSLDRISVDRNCVLSVDRNCGNQLTEFLDGFQLIKSLNNEFDQTPKKLSLDRKFY